MTYKTVKDYFLRKTQCKLSVFCLHDIFVSCFLELVCK